MKSTLERAKRAVTTYFQNAARRVYRVRDLEQALAQNRDHWQLAQRTRIEDFIEFLLRNTKLQAIHLKSNSYPEIVRYAWGEVSPYQMALSRRDGAYLSHATAMSVHELTHQRERTIYVNAEQSPKPQAGSLTQDGIDRAFAREQRYSNLIYQYKNWTLVFLEGKNTARLGVLSRRGPSGELLEVTGLERTLIDIVVRPSYAGGTSQVLAAYKVAKTKLSVDLLLKTLKKLDYLYPYHQAIGFYMSRAGYPAAHYEKLRKLSVQFDFYLAHNMAATAYDPYWRLYYPKELPLPHQGVARKA
jgi:hypothetical protein